MIRYQTINAGEFAQGGLLRVIVLSPDTRVVDVKINDWGNVMLHLLCPELPVQNIYTAQVEGKTFSTYTLYVEFVSEGVLLNHLDAKDFIKTMCYLDEPYAVFASVRA